MNGERRGENRMRKGETVFSQCYVKDINAEWMMGCSVAQATIVTVFGAADQNEFLVEPEDSTDVRRFIINLRLCLHCIR